MHRSNFKTDFEEDGNPPQIYVYLNFKLQISCAENIIHFSQNYLRYRIISSLLIQFGIQDAMHEN